jgi:sugar lactone lactonase YvrE
MPKPIMTQHDRERALFRYRNALLRADFDTVAKMLSLAERDAVLWQMLNESHEQDDGLLESDATDASLSDIITYNFSSNGTSPKTHSQEDKIMNIAIPNPNRQLKPYPRMLSAIAAVLLLFVFGAILVTMITLPTGSNFGQVVELTQAPLKAGCQLTTTAAANDESLRLAQAADNVLEADEPDTELALLLGICALQTDYTREADALLQQAMVAADLVPEFPTYSRAYLSAQFSPDGHYLLTADSRDGAHLWDVATGTEVRIFPSESRSFNAPSVAFSPDGKYVLTTIEPTVARLWEVETGAVVRDFNTTIESFAFSPDGTRIALGSYQQVQLWDTAAGTLVDTLIAHSNPNPANGVQYLAFSPDGNSLLVNTGGPWSVQLWDLQTGTKIRDFLGIEDPLSAIFSPDGRYVIAGGRPTDARAILWDTATGADVHTFADFPNLSDYNHVQAFAFSPDGRYVLIGSANRTAKIYEVETGVEVRSFNDNPNYVGTVAFSPDGKRILINSLLNRIRIWSTDYRDMLADACQGISRDFTAEEREQYGIRGGAPTCPQFAEGYALEHGMTPMPTHPIPVWTPLPTLESTGE